MKYIFLHFQVRENHHREYYKLTRIEAKLIKVMLNHEEHDSSNGEVKI